MRKGYQRGFTLIELLIVIVIIGILAGVLIAVINPVQQQNRARDAAVQASLEKVALVAQSHVSAYGRAPTSSEIIDGIDNETVFGGFGDCTVTVVGAQNCLFEITGSELPLTGANSCDLDNWRRTVLGGAGAGQCYFRYFRSATWPATDEGRFRLYAKSWGLTDRIFVLDNSYPGMWHCNAAANLDNISDLPGAGVATCERL